MIFNKYKIYINKNRVYARTAHNRIVNASPPNGGLGSVRLGHGYAIHTPHCATVCRPWSLLRKALIRAGKPSFTTVTLGASLPKQFLKI